MALYYIMTEGSDAVYYIMTEGFDTTLGKDGGM